MLNHKISIAEAWLRVKRAQDVPTKASGAVEGPVSSRNDKDLSDYERETNEYVGDRANKTPVEFDLEEFEKITTVERMVDNANKLLTPVSEGKGEGKGSSRLVFNVPWDSRKVLKIGYGYFGQYQNFKESMLSEKSPIFTKVYDSDPDSKWIVAEKVKPFKSDNEFSNKTGFELYDIQTVHYYLKKDIWTDDEVKEMLKEQFRLSNKAIYYIFEIYEIMRSYDILRGDMLDSTHWGISLLDGKVKIYDYGADTELIRRTDKLEEDMENKKKNLELAKQSLPENIPGGKADFDAKTVASVYYPILKLAFNFGNAVDNLKGNIFPKANAEKVEIALQDAKIWPLINQQITRARSKAKVSFTEPFYLIVSPEMNISFRTANQSFQTALNEEFKKFIYEAQICLKGCLRNERVKNQDKDLLFFKPDEEIVIEVEQ